MGDLSSFSVVGKVCSVGLTCVFSLCNSRASLPALASHSACIEVLWQETCHELWGHRGNRRLANEEVWADTEMGRKGRVALKKKKDMFVGKLT